MMTTMCFAKYIYDFIYIMKKKEPKKIVHHKTPIAMCRMCKLNRKKKSIPNWLLLPW